MIGEPMEKPRQFAKRAFLVLWIAGLGCLLASDFVDAPRVLHRGLGIAAIVLMASGLVFLIRGKRAKKRITG
jgi:hypothetical protein